MDTDPWGSSTTGDPWSTSKAPPPLDLSGERDDDKPKDVLNVPKEFLIARKPSADGADPWSTPSGVKSDGKDEDEGEGLGGEKEVMKPAWAEVDDAWARPAETTVTEEPEEAVGSSSPMGDTYTPKATTFPQDTTTIPSPPLAPLNLSSLKPYTLPSMPSTPPAQPASPSRGFNSSPFQSYNEDASYNPFSTSASPVLDRETSSSPFRADSPPLPLPIISSSSIANALPTFGASSSSLPQSPTFGDDAFGGFSGAMEMDMDMGLKGNDDAMPSWGGGTTFAGAGGADDGWGSPTFDTGGFGATAVRSPGGDEDEEEGEEGDEWGGARPAVGRVASAREDDWDEARRAIERREARAPTELVKRLEKEWKGLALEHNGAKSEREKVGGSGGGDDGLDRITMAKRDELFDKLTSLPPEITTFQPNISMTITHARYQDSISSLDLNTRTSLLALVSRQNATYASRRQSAQWQVEWDNRSKLGEPEAEKVGMGLEAGRAAGRNSSEERSKWSFWGRRQSTQGVPLVTSGGGILEVKTITPNQTGTGMATASGSRAGSVVNTPGGSGLPVVPEVGVLQSPLQVGSPLQVSPSMPSALPSSIAPLAATTQSPTSQSKAPIPTTDEVPAPSAVGRFFGRFRRARQDTPSASASVDLSNKDLTLGQDDFSFLDQVPSSAPPSQQPHQFGPGDADLLSMDGPPGKNEQLTGLEAMLSSKPIALPSRLAPPPHSRSNSRQSSTGSIPKLGGPGQNSRSSSNVDLFADLDFSGNGAGVVQTSSPVQASPVYGSGGGSGGGLFDIMAASTTPPPALSPPPARAGGASTGFDFSDFDNLAGPSRPSLPPAPVPKLQQPVQAPKLQTPSGPAPPPALAKADDDGFGDFGDFGDFGGGGNFAAPVKGGGGDDDFGDFGDFGSFGNGSSTQASALPSINKLPAPTPRLAQPIPQMHFPAPAARQADDFSYLDNFGSSAKPTQAQALVDNAKQVQGRWPAPVSPVPDAISPPPPGKSSFFPKLDPPTRSTSARSTPPPPPPAGPSKPVTPFGFDMGGMSVPMQSASPVPRGGLTPQQNGLGGIIASGTAANNKGTLSAQDLSFFDSL